MEPYFISATTTWCIMCWLACCSKILLDVEGKLNEYKTKTKLKPEEKKNTHMLLVNIFEN